MEHDTVGIVSEESRPLMITSAALYSRRLNNVDRSVLLCLCDYIQWGAGEPEPDNDVIAELLDVRPDEVLAAKIRLRTHGFID